MTNLELAVVDLVEILAAPPNVEAALSNIVHGAETVDSQVSKYQAWLNCVKARIQAIGAATNPDLEADGLFLDKTEIINALFPGTEARNRKALKNRVKQIRGY